MIKINTKYGRKEIFANVFQNVFSTNVSTTEYLHSSQHQTPTTNKYSIHLTNKVTNSKTDFELTYEGENNRGAYFSFILGDGTGGTWNIPELGSYEYIIYAMSTTGGVNYSDKVSELDRGLFHIFNNDTFEDKYIDEPSITIPSVKVYKPS